ncbi:hypothetical protein P7C73_g1316, partial [Tremellales sp. Uapishka_1]
MRPYDVLSFTFTFFLLLSTPTFAAMFANMVIDSEKHLAEQIDAYSEAHRNTYEAVGRTSDNRISVQIRYGHDDSVGIEAFFTPTPALLADLEDSQRAIAQASIDTGLEGGSTFEQMRDFRIEVPGHNPPHSPSHHKDSTPLARDSTSLTARYDYEFGCSIRKCARDGNFLESALRPILRR